MDNSESQDNPQNNETTSEEQKDKFQFNILMEEESSEAMSSITSGLGGLGGLGGGLPF